jgi:hypothetical protein
MTMKMMTALLVAVTMPLLAYACEEASNAPASNVSAVSADSDNGAEVAEAAPGDAKTEDIPTNPRRRALMGKLLETKEISLQGQDAKHVLAKIETPSGHIVIADLGTRQDVKDAKLSAGEQIEVYGVVGRLNNRPLLVAEQMGEVINIKRTSNEIPQPTSFHRGDQDEAGGKKLKDDKADMQQQKVMKDAEPQKDDSNLAPR